jgi:hypothetical protein
MVECSFAGALVATGMHSRRCRVDGLSCYHYEKELVVAVCPIRLRRSKG